MLFSCSGKVMWRWLIIHIADEVRESFAVSLEFL